MNATHSAREANGSAGEILSAAASVGLRVRQVDHVGENSIEEVISRA